MTATPGTVSSPVTPVLVFEFLQLKTRQNKADTVKISLLYSCRNFFLRDHYKDTGSRITNGRDYRHLFFKHKSKPSPVIAIVLFLPIKKKVSYIYIYIYHIYIYI